MPCTLSRQVVGEEWAGVGQVVCGGESAGRASAGLVQATLSARTSNLMSSASSAISSSTSSPSESLPTSPPRWRFAGRRNLRSPALDPQTQHGTRDPQGTSSTAQGGETSKPCARASHLEEVGELWAKLGTDPAEIPQGTSRGWRRTRNSAQPSDSAWAQHLQAPSSTDGPELLHGQLAVCCACRCPAADAVAEQVIAPAVGRLVTVN